MKRYVLLRENREMGTFTLEELKEQEISHSDLIWIEGESCSWSKPQLIPEIRPLLAHQHNKEETNAEPLKRKRTPIHHISWVAVLLASFVVGNFIARMYYRNNDSQGLLQAMQTESMVPESGIIPEHYHDALGHDYKWKDTTQNKAIAFVKKGKNKAYKNMVSVKTSDYKIGLFGGISDLHLTLLNNSPVSLDKVSVIVDYIKPNGTVARSEKYYFLDVDGRSSKTISVPASKRGVKVHAYVKKIVPEEVSTTML